MEKAGKGIWRYLKITFAALIYSAGVSLFFDANQLAPGGVTGIAIIISRFIPVETGTLIFLLNLPICGNIHHIHLARIPIPRLLGDEDSWFDNTH